MSEFDQFLRISYSFGASWIYVLKAILKYPPSRYITRRLDALEAVLVLLTIKLQCWDVPILFLLPSVLLDFLVLVPFLLPLALFDLILCRDQHFKSSKVSY